MCNDNEQTFSDHRDRFPRISYEAAEQMVADYKERKEGAAERLINAYRGYLLSFLNLINQGNLDLRYKPTRKFLMLFVADPDKRKRIATWVYSKTGIKEALKVKQMIVEQFKCYSREELYNELVCVLLEMANRYEKKDQSGFHNYMWTSFHFYAYRALQPLIADPLVWHMDENVSMGEKFEGTDACGDYLKSSTQDMIHDIDKEAVRTIDEELDSLSDNWINGLTCSPIFAELNPFERRILKEYYANHWEDQEIADQLAACRATINRRRLAAERKVFAAAEKAGYLVPDDEYVERLVAAQTDGKRGKKSIAKAEDQARRLADRNLKLWRKKHADDEM